MTESLECRKDSQKQIREGLALTGYPGAGKCIYIE